MRVWTHLAAVNRKNRHERQRSRKIPEVKTADCVIG